MKRNYPITSYPAVFTCPFGSKGVFCTGLLACWLLLPTTRAAGDGGTVQLSQSVGDNQITVMTDPTPLRAGQIDVSVMTQGPRGQIEHNGRVTVCLRSLDERHSVIRAEATSSAATNKLLRMARIDVPQPGPWELTVTWAKNAQPIVAQTKVNIAEKPTGWHNITGWIAAPFVLIGLYAVGEILAARQSRRRPRHAMLNS